jgi:hypothetical protein
MRASIVAILLRKMSEKLAQTRQAFELPKPPSPRCPQAHLDGARWLLCFARHDALTTADARKHRRHLAPQDERKAGANTQSFRTSKTPCPAMRDDLGAIKSMAPSSPQVPQDPIGVRTCSPGVDAQRPLLGKGAHSLADSDGGPHRGPVRAVSKKMRGHRVDRLDGTPTGFVIERGSGVIRGSQESTRSRSALLDCMTPAPRA